MKITKTQLRQIIKEEKAKLLESEQYVDDEGNIYDDEGNVTLRKRSNSFLESVLAQLKDGRRLSTKQKNIVRKIIMKYDPKAASLFERMNRP